MYYKIGKKKKEKPKSTFGIWRLCNLVLNFVDNAKKQMTLVDHNFFFSRIGVNLEYYQVK